MLTWLHPFAAQLAVVLCLMGCVFLNGDDEYVKQRVLCIWSGKLQQHKSIICKRHRSKLCSDQHITKGRMLCCSSIHKHCWLPAFFLPPMH